TPSTTSPSRRPPPLYDARRDAHRDARRDARRDALNVVNDFTIFVKYSARFNAEAVRNFLYSLNNGTIAKKKFNCMYAILFYSQRKYIIAIHVFVSNCLAFNQCVVKSWIDGIEWRGAVMDG
ncbi:hypothetical protein RYX36_036559, partial [Vicia faba]